MEGIQGAGGVKNLKIETTLFWKNGAVVEGYKATLLPKEIRNNFHGDAGHGVTIEEATSDAESKKKERLRREKSYS